MIRRTLLATQDATFCVQLPSLHPAAGGLPVPTGTGFFVADDGWFVTARHVVAHADGSLRSDVGDAWLMKEMRGFGGSGAMCQWPELVFEDAVSDLALLKVDFSRNANKDWLSGREGSCGAGRDGRGDGTAAARYVCDCRLDSGENGDGDVIRRPAVLRSRQS